MHPEQYPQRNTHHSSASLLYTADIVAKVSKVDDTVYDIKCDANRPKDYECKLLLRT